MNCLILQRKEDFNLLIEDDYKERCENEIFSKINITQCIHETSCTLRFDIKALPQECKVNSDIFSSNENAYLVGYATCEGTNIKIFS